MEITSEECAKKKAEKVIVRYFYKWNSPSARIYARGNEKKWRFGSSHYIGR